MYLEPVVIDGGTAAFITLGLTAALVVVTGYYAWQNQRMVNEMRAARSAQLLPRVMPSVASFGPGLIYLRVSNVGPGPALHVELTLRLEPGEWVHPWTTGVIAPMEKHDFYPRSSEDQAVMRLPQLTDRYQQFRIVGTCTDAVGKRYGIDEAFDIRVWWEYIQETGHRLERDWQEETAKELKRVADELHEWTNERRQDRASASVSASERWQWRFDSYLRDARDLVTGRRARMKEWLRRR